MASGARRVTDGMFAAAARGLARTVSDEDLEMGRIFPSLATTRETSLVIVTAVARVAYEEGLATIPEPESPGTFTRGEMFEPIYPGPA